jgi:polysaccharide export outer membrane protein
MKPSGRPLEELTAVDPAKEIYLVRPGDILLVDVYGEPSLSGERAVREDGQLSIKFIGDVRVEGLTLEKTAKKIEQELSRFIPATTVSVNLSRSAPIKYYLAGKFMQPGEKRSDGRINLLQAIATGGQFQPFANESAITLIRRTNEGELRYVLDYNRVLTGKDPNPELKDGDLITVGQ